MIEALSEISSSCLRIAYGQAVYETAKQPPAERRFGDTKIIPAITLSERYDSNILFAPSGLNFGREKWDFITSLMPTLQVLNKNRYADTTVTTGVNGSLFVNNPDLNFVSTFLTGTSVLDSFINQFLRGGKLQISDSFSYTPESPSFVSAATPVSTDNPFARGIVPVRADMIQNTAAIRAGYPIAPGLSLQAGYSYSLLRVEKILVAQQPISTTAIFFNTDYHTWSAGPTWRLSRSDELGLVYKSTTINLRDTAGLDPSASFTSRGAEATYATKAGDWTASASGGGTILEDRLYYTGTLTLSTKIGESTYVRVIGSRQMAPGYFGTPGALISTTAGISVEHKFARDLTLSGSANYAYNALAPVKLTTFESYATSALLKYRISRVIATSLQYSFTYFDSSSLDAATQNRTGYLVNRHVTLFSITATWN